VVERRWFEDHHQLTAAELEAALRRGAELGAVVVTTVKDAVKMPPDTAIWVVEANMVPVSGSWDELWRLVPEVGP
jgi:tetraacyldisaccharide 4'-kinase